MTMASGDLPDLIIGAGFSTSDLVRYGELEGQFIDLAPYINETYMPNLTSIYEEYPELKTNITDANGKIWSLGIVNEPGDVDNYARMFMDYKLLEDCGLEAPETLDELLTALRTIKEKYPDMYPIGGSWVRHSPIDYILNGFGYIITGNYNNGQKIALRNGEPVIPVADREAYGAFLEFMHTCYEEGLIHPDFFTMDKATTEAEMSAGNNALYAQSSIFYLDNWRDWWGALPLTSEYNDTAAWANPSAQEIGGGVITSACEEPELAAAFMDWFYTSRNFYMNYYGPHVEEDSDVLFGTDGWKVDEETGSIYHLYKDVVGEENYNETDYRNSMSLTQHLYSIGTTRNDGTSIQEHRSAFLSEYDVNEPVTRRYDEEYIDNMDDFFRLQLHTTLGQHLTDEIYPDSAYLSVDDAEEANNLWVVIKEYATQETAKFITGARSLDEVDQYFDDIEALGATDLLKIYTDYYNSIK